MRSQQPFPPFAPTPTAPEVTALIARLAETYPHDARTLRNVVEEAHGDEALARRVLDTGLPAFALRLFAVLTLCQGCDEEQADVQPFDVTYNALAGEKAGQTERVHYCPDCAALAEANWNGVTASLTPVEN